jgi:hypothetical protein
MFLIKKYEKLVNFLFSWIFVGICGDENEKEYPPLAELRMGTENNFGGGVKSREASSAYFLSAPLTMIYIYETNRCSILIYKNYSLYSLNNTSKILITVVFYVLF